jgi:hypothetical protein
MPSQGTSSNFKLVGHNSLFSRGMNAGPAIYKNFLYVGSRTDGSAGHEHAGVLVVNINKPSKPKVVGEIGRPNEALPSQTSRELRVWPDEKLLIVMNFRCSTFIHACVRGPRVWDFKFYSLNNPARPRLLSTYVSSQPPHEMFLWVDPQRAGRALLFISTPHNSVTPDDSTPNLIVTDISGAREGVFEEVATFTANPLYSEEDHETRNIALHSMAPSPDGNRTYLSYLMGGFLVLDSSDLAEDVEDPQLTLLTPVENSPTWPNQSVHSAVKVPNRDLVITTDELYGNLLDPPLSFEDHGCPWGWVHVIDVSDESNPQLVGEYKIDENTQEYCETPDGRDPANTWFTSFASHNPTILENVGLTTWHSGGFQAYDLTDPANPVQSGVFVPEPLIDVDTEDTALSQGLNKVVLWSYPIIKDGLIYVIDVRNGLYVLQYQGAHASDVGEIDFYEGNSNLGDALELDAG